MEHEADCKRHGIDLIAVELPGVYANSSITVYKVQHLHRWTWWALTCDCYFIRAKRECMRNHPSSLRGRTL